MNATWVASTPRANPGNLPNLQIPSEAIAAFCRRNHIRRLSLFGSVLGDDFRPESDVDVLVVFQPGFVVGLRILEMEAELSALLGGRKVDFVNEKYLNPRLRERILASAEVQYAEG